MANLPERTYTIEISEPDADGVREFDILADGESMLDHPRFITEEASLEATLNVVADIDPAFGRGWGGFTDSLDSGDHDGQ